MLLILQLTLNQQLQTNNAMTILGKSVKFIPIRQDNLFSTDLVNPLKPNDYRSDKLAHFFRDYLITCILIDISALFFTTVNLNIALICLLISTLANFLYEIKDGIVQYKGDGFSWLDFIAGFIGSNLAVYLFMIFKFYSTSSRLSAIIITISGIIFLLTWLIGLFDHLTTFKINNSNSQFKQ